jgi:DNA-binding Lrp family transcriptional regulator
VIKLTQHDLALVSEPFEDVKNRLDISYDELFKTLDEFKKAGVMRRFAGILNHRKAGFGANAMVVWDVDEQKGEEIGKVASSFSAVSHCYLRPKYPNWRYNLFTMIHGKTTDETNSVIEEIANEIEYKSKMPLYSTQEFKKQRIIYFSNNFYNWEEKYL